MVLIGSEEQRYAGAMMTQANIVAGVLGVEAQVVPGGRHHIEDCPVYAEWIVATATRIAAQGE